MDGGPMRAALIVEGDGDVQALPLIWRFLCPCMPLGRPYRLPRSKALDPQGNVRREEWERVFRFLRLEKATCVLVVVDADDICPKSQAATIRSDLQGVITALGIGLKLGFCLAYPEYEGWFLAGADLLNLGDPVINDMDLPRDCKGEVKKRLGKYSPTVDQARLTGRLLDHLRVVATRSPSLDKLIREITSLCNCSNL